MSEKIYVLIKVEAGAIESVLDDITKVMGVTEASAVTGPYDIFAKIEGDWLIDAMTIVMKSIQKINGIKSTETLVAVSLDENVILEKKRKRSLLFEPGSYEK